MTSQSTLTPLPALQSLICFSALKTAKVGKEIELLADLKHGVWTGSRAFGIGYFCYTLQLACRSVASSGKKMCLTNAKLPISSASEIAFAGGVGGSSCSEVFHVEIGQQFHTHDESCNTHISFDTC